MANSKIVLGNGEVLMDLTADTVKETNLLKGYTAHGSDGEKITGACTFDADTTDATANDSEILSGKIAYAKGNRLVGKMSNNGAVEGTISTKAGKYTVPQGYHDGSGTVQISPSEQDKLIPSNIRDGVTILGVEGTMSGSEGIKSQSREATPSFVEQTILPQAGYTHLSQVTIKAIPVSYTDNSSGGKTVTVG